MGYGDFHLEVIASLPAQGTAQLKVISLGEQFQDHWELSDSEFNSRLGPSSRRELTSLFSTLSCISDPLEGQVKPWLKGRPGPQRRRGVGPRNHSPPQKSSQTTSRCQCPSRQLGLHCLILLYNNQWVEPLA